MKLILVNRKMLPFINYLEFYENIHVVRYFFIIKLGRAAYKKINLSSDNNPTPTLSPLGKYFIFV